MIKRNPFSCAETRTASVARIMPVVILILSSLLPHAQPARAASSAVVGSGTPASCTEAALDAALPSAGLITFNCGAAPHTITLTVQKALIANTIFDGAGRIALSGGAVTRHFFVTGGVAATFKNITLTNGYSPVGGGAIETAGGYITLENVTLSGNSALDQGGAIYCFVGTDGVLTVTNSIFTGNRSNRGGALFNSGCPGKISNTLFNLNEAGTAGGAIFCDGPTTRAFVSAENQFEANTAPRGGALSATGCAMQVSGGMFASNAATSTMTVTKLGGAIYHETAGLLQVTGTQFLRNTAFDGGAIMVGSGVSAQLTATTFVSNSATYGGAIENSGALTLTHSSFRENAAASLGGAIWALGGTVVISGSHFERNRAAFHGGATHLQGSASIRSSSFIANSAQGNGGAVYASFDTVSVENSTFGENVSPNFGAALYADQKTLLKYVTVYSNTSMAGALYGQDGIGVPEPLFIQATLFAKNAGGACGGKITSVRNSMADDMSCGGVLIAPNDKSNARLDFGALTGAGATRFYLPRQGNEGIDLLPGADCFMMDGSAPHDQRAIARPQSGKCDSGAIEVRAEDLRSVVYAPLIQRN
jgi:predicted outer membrane repeat protein